MRGGGLFAMAVLGRLSVSSAPPVAALRGGAAGPLALRVRLPAFGVACLLGFVVGSKVSLFSRRS